MEYNKKDLYVVITWPDSQALMEEEGFDDNCYAMPDDSGAYFVNIDWPEHTNQE